MCFLFVLRSHLMQKMSLKIPYQQLVMQNHVPQPVSGRQDSELSPSCYAFLRAPQPVPLALGCLLCPKDQVRIVHRWELHGQRLLVQSTSVLHALFSLSFFPKNQQRFDEEISHLNLKKKKHKKNHKSKYVLFYCYICSLRLQICEQKEVW